MDVDVPRDEVDRVVLRVEEPEEPQDDDEDREESVVLLLDAHACPPVRESDGTGGRRLCRSGGHKGIRLAGHSRGPDLRRRYSIPPKFIYVRPRSGSWDVGGVLRVRRETTEGGRTELTGTEMGTSRGSRRRTERTVYGTRLRTSVWKTTGENTDRYWKTHKRSSRSTNVSNKTEGNSTSKRTSSKYGTTLWDR